MTVNLCLILCVCLCLVAVLLINSVSSSSPSVTGARSNPNTSGRLQLHRAKTNLIHRTGQIGRTQTHGIQGGVQHPNRARWQRIDDLIKKFKLKSGAADRKTETKIKIKTDVSDPDLVRPRDSDRAPEKETKIDTKKQNEDRIKETVQEILEEVAEAIGIRIVDEVFDELHEHITNLTSESVTMPIVDDFGEPAEIGQNPDPVTVKITHTIGSNTDNEMLVEDHNAEDDDGVSLWIPLGSSLLGAVALIPILIFLVVAAKKTWPQVVGLGPRAALGRGLARIRFTWCSNDESRTHANEDV